MQCVLISGVLSFNELATISFTPAKLAEMPSVSYSLTPVCTKRLLFFPNVLSFAFTSCHILSPLKRFFPSAA